MRIKNRTCYATADIRRLIYRVAQDELDPGNLKKIEVEVGYHRRRTSECGGRATSGTLKRGYGWMKLLLPGPAMGGVDSVDLAQVIAHEMAHLRGLGHREMHSPRYDRVDGYRDRYAWAADFLMRISAPKPQPGPAERPAKSLAHATAMLAKSERRLKLATTIVRRWRGRVRYYERVLAKAAAAAEQPDEEQAASA